MKEARNPGDMLAQARDGLRKCRQTFILSTVMLMLGPTKIESQAFWKNTWLKASLEEERITRELVAPAKRKTGAFRTVPKVERGVRKEASDFIKKEVLLERKGAFGVASAIVNPHIIFTKKIQEEMGVQDQIVYSEKPKPKRHAIFARRSTSPLRKSVS